MPAAIATRYARALVDVVFPSGAAERTLTELRAFADVLAGSNELKLALESPAVAKARKLAVVTKLGAALGLSKPVRNFLMVLVDHRRLAVLGEITSAFEKLISERLGILKVDVTAAYPLNDVQQAALASGIGAATGKKVGLNLTVDSALIGGVVARIGSTVYDGSVRGKLDTLGKKLAEG